MPTLVPFVLTGAYEDEHRVEPVEWLIRPAVRPRGNGFEIRAVIRGVEVSGPDFDALELADEEAALAAGIGHPDVRNCRMSGHGSCMVAISGVRTAAELDFDFAYGASVHRLEVTLTVGDIACTAADKSFEDCLERIEASLPKEIQLVGCLTCRWSGHELFTWTVTGLRCCRDAKEQHLAARNEAERSSVPVAEFVPEFHLCAEYERRDPPTASRAARQPDATLAPAGA